MTEVPEGGMCLSAFVLVSPPGEPWAVLMGHLNPDAPWDHIGALDAARALANAGGWMLPSSHLIFREGPEGAAARIAREQLGMERLELVGPKVVSESYLSKRFPNGPDHWDLEFIFRGAMRKEDIHPVIAWRELRFVDTRSLARSDIARSHEDILQSAGFALP